MKFSKTRAVKIVMVGAGGTGGYVAPHIYRLLSSLDRPSRVIIADGDLVEEKNLIRQNFIRTDLGRNKATVIAERYAASFGMEIHYIPEFIESEQRLHSLFRTRHDPYEEDINILIGAVDNNKSRQMCHTVFNAKKEMIYIDSGNGEYTGQVVCGIRRNSRTYYEPVGSLYPDILSDEDKFPSELSCAEAAQSAPQSMAANIMASTAVVVTLYNILALGNLNVEQITFSSKSIILKPHLRKPRSKKVIKNANQIAA